MPASKTKRGNDYGNRSNKQATGYSKVLADCKAMKGRGINDKAKERLTRLAVRGTLDTIGGLHWNFKTITRRDPATGVKTRLKVLNENGCWKLIRLRRKRAT